MKTLPHLRFLVFLAIFAGAALGASLAQPAADSIVLGFDLAALGFIGSCLPLWRNDGLAAMRARAARDDGGRVLLLVVALIVLGVVLLALGGMIGGRHSLTARDFAVVTGTLGLAWLFVNLVYAFHYAHLYYDRTTRPGHPGPEPHDLDFPGSEPPLFADFCYFSFVIGMTSQVSDVTITTTRMRRVVTMHGLIAFGFNLGVLALTINVLSGVL